MEKESHSGKKKIPIHLLPKPQVSGRNLLGTEDKRIIDAQVRKLKQINRKIKQADPDATMHDNWNSGHKVKTFTAYLILVTIAITCISSAIYLGPSITGLVTFSESVVMTDSKNIIMDSPGTLDLKTDLDAINSVLLSGTVYGKGKAAVFLVGPEKDYLVYYFEGDAKTGYTFEDMCYGSCHVEGLDGNNTLRFELEGTRIDIDRIKYMYNKIIDFDLEPRSITIDYDQEPAKIINLRLTNNEHTDYTVLLYIDGPLSSSFSWQGSLIHMTADTSDRALPITIKLPSNLAAGEYVHKITARYVPPGTYDFVGESPVAETFVTIKNG
ncbi:MAG: hypothetical protein ABIA62_03185 [Candidatus Woesearchaeota archaeon]